MTYDLVVRNGTIIDGSGSPRVRADVGVTDGVISAIGRLSVAEVGASGVVYDPEVHYEEVRRKWWGIDITHDDGRREHIDAWQGDVKHESIK